MAGEPPACQVSLQDRALVVRLSVDKRNEARNLEIPLTLQMMCTDRGLAWPMLFHIGQGIATGQVAVYAFLHFVLCISHITYRSLLECY